MSQFSELCDMIWSQKFHGDVTGLKLSDASYEELRDECLADGLGILVPDDIPTGVPVGATLTALVNPVTRSMVDVSGGGTSTLVTISYGPVFGSATTWYPG